MSKWWFWNVIVLEAKIYKREYLSLNRKILHIPLLLTIMSYGLGFNVHNLWIFHYYIFKSLIVDALKLVVIVAICQELSRECSTLLHSVVSYGVAWRISLSYSCSVLFQNQRIGFLWKWIYVVILFSVIICVGLKLTQVILIWSFSFGVDMHCWLS